MIKSYKTMEAYNFIFKAEWIKRLDGLNKEQRTLTVMAIYDYIVYGKLSDNNYVNFAISWIRDEIDRMKQARERRQARMEEKRRIAEEQKAAEASESSENSEVSEISDNSEPSETSTPSDTSPGHLPRNCQKATADAAATFSESTLCDIGMRHTMSASAMTS